MSNSWKMGRISKLIESVNLKIYIALLVLFINAVISVFIATNLYLKQGEIAKASHTYSEALIVTDRGTISISFNIKAPAAVQNFIKLAESGYYNGLHVHRIVTGVMFEMGDPLSRSLDLKSKWGNGGPGYTFADEINSGEKMNAGVVAMVNNGPNTNGSQFFILAKDSEWLDGQHTILGYVTRGQEVVNEISSLPVSVLGIPLEDILVKEVHLK